jgi:hypothetical protein
MVQILAHLALTENPLRHRFHTVWVVCDTWRGTVGTWVAFRDSYNTIWLAERHGFITPETLRQTQLLANAKAA